MMKRELDEVLEAWQEDWRLGDAKDAGLLGHGQLETYRLQRVAWDAAETEKGRKRMDPALAQSALILIKHTRLLRPCGIGHIKTHGARP